MCIESYKVVIPIFISILFIVYTVIWRWCNNVRLGSAGQGRIRQFYIFKVVLNKNEKIQKINKHLILSKNICRLDFDHCSFYCLQQWRKSTVFIVHLISQNIKILLLAFIKKYSQIFNILKFNSYYRLRSHKNYALFKNYQKLFKIMHNLMQKP